MSRLRAAWQVLTGRSRAYDPREVSTIVGRRVIDAARTDAAVRKGTRETLVSYREQPWFRAVLGKIASDAAGWKPQLYRAASGDASGIGRGDVLQAVAEGELEPVQRHPLLTLLKRPSPIFSPTQVWRLWEIHRRAVGEVFWVTESNTAGEPVEVYPMPPHWLLQIPTREAPNFRFSGGGVYLEVAPEGVIWVREADAENPYGRGAGEGLALSDDLSADEQAARMMAARFTNGGLPAAIVALKDAPAEVVKEAEERWNARYGGGENAGRTHFTQGGAVSVETLSQSFVDLQLHALRQHERDTIRQVFGVPPEILGITESSNRATITAAEDIYARRVLVPALDSRCEELSTHLLPLYEDGESLVLSYQSPVPDDVDGRRELMIAVPAAFTINDVRQEAGLPVLEEGGDASAVPVPVPVLPMLPRGQRPDPPWASRSGRGWDRGRWEQLRLRAQDDGSEALRDGVVRPMFQAQRERVTKAVRSGLVRADPSDPSDDDIAKVLYDDDDRWTGAYETTASKQATATLRETLVELGLDPDAFDLKNPRIAQWAREQAARFIVDVNETSAQTLRSLFAEAADEGWNVDRIAKAVEDTFDQWTDDGDATRAMRIARTETVAAQNYGAVEGMVEAGVEEVEWFAIGDAFTRATHAALDGSKVRVGETFANGLRWPGDMQAGLASETVNCRCTVNPVLD